MSAGVKDPGVASGVVNVPIRVPPLILVHDADYRGPVTCIRQPDGTYVLTVPPEAMIAEVQAAIDAMNIPWTVSRIEPLFLVPEGPRRRPGPPPRRETSRERSLRWRRERR
ncbi:hypothetical protein KJ909_03945 [Patescibacteria group bacterium]|nr:hypothetical protein [Patescibacteria group bacterium]